MRKSQLNEKQLKEQEVLRNNLAKRYNNPTQVEDAKEIGMEVSNYNKFLKGGTVGSVVFERIKTWYGNLSKENR